MASRKNSSDSSHDHRRRNRSKSFSRDRKNNKYPSKKDDYYSNDLKNTLKKESDIKNHIKFMNLKIHPQNQHSVIENLKKKLAESVGPITHITRIPNTSHQKYQQYLSFVVGFKYDINALDFLYGKCNDLEIRYHKDMIKFKPIPTQVFELLIPKLKPLWKQKMDKNHREKSHSRQRGSKKQDQKNDRRKYSRQSSSRSRNKKNRKKASYSSSNSYSPKPKPSLTLKTVLIFGIPTFTRDKKITQILQDMKQQSFVPQSFKWRRVQNSNAEYLELGFEIKKAQKLLNLREKIRIDGFPVIIIEGTNSSQAIKKQLKSFQFLIKFPQKVHPFSIYRGLSQCGKIVQLVAEQQLQEGLSDSYTVTISNRQLANDIKKIGKTTEEIIISDLNEGQLIYRPSQHSSLHNLQKKDRIQKQSR